MDDNIGSLENIVWSEEGLLSLKYNVLRKIAKEKCIVHRNRKKIDLVKALLNTSLQPNNEEFHGSNVLDKIDKAADTPERRSTFIIPKSNINERRSSLKSGIFEKDRRSTYSKDDGDNTEDIINERKSLLKSGIVEKDRRSTYSKDDKENIENIINERRSLLKSGNVVEDGHSTYSTEDEDNTENINKQRSSLKSGIVEEASCSYSKEDDELCEELNNTISFTENDESSLIRVTPVKEELLQPVTLTKKVTFQIETKVEETPVNRCAPRKRVTTTPYIIKEVKFQKGTNAERTSMSHSSRKQIKTPNKTKEVSAKVLSAKKMPNFSAIHKEAFGKMESLIDMKNRWAEKRRKISLHNVPRCAMINETPTSEIPRYKMLSKPLQAVKPAQCNLKPKPTKPKVKPSSSSNVNRFGFKERITKDFAKQIISKDVNVHSVKNEKDKNMEILKGVRKNRRFTLQMQARGFKQ